MADDASAVMRRVLAALSRRDLDGALADFDEDVELDWSASRNIDVGTYQGREEVRRFVLGYWETFDQMELTPGEFAEHGDVVAVGMHARFARADGIAAETRFALVATMRDGRIVRLRMEQGLAEALETLDRA